MPEWWARIDGNKNPPRAALERRIPIVDVAGDAGIAKIVSKVPDMTIEDYMSLLKVGGRWWIVGKIFHRTEAAAPPRTPQALEADRDAIRAVASEMIAAMDASDPDRLGAAVDPRAMTYSVVDGQLVGVPIAEWQARLAARRAGAKAEQKAERCVAAVDSEGDTGIAKLEHARGAQRRVDYASLVKTGGRWRVVGVVTNGSTGS
jgi:hypothetical protein